ncbi:MAG: spore coat associated protein CotJA [Clostridia bacterium]|jgi:hypothetical protein
MNGNWMPGSVPVPSNHPIYGPRYPMAPMMPVNRPPLPNMPAPNMPAPHVPLPNEPAPNRPAPTAPISNEPAPNMPMPNMPAPDKPCIPQETTLTNVRLATAYVPFQKFCGTFTPIEALSKGTAFPELYSPYIPENKHSKPRIHE